MREKSKGRSHHSAKEQKKTEKKAVGLRLAIRQGQRASLASLRASVAPTGLAQPPWGSLTFSPGSSE